MHNKELLRLKRYKYEDLDDLNPRPAFLSCMTIKQYYDLILVFRECDKTYPVDDGPHVRSLIDRNFLKVIRKITFDNGTRMLVELTFKGYWIMWNCDCLLTKLNKPIDNYQYNLSNSPDEGDDE